MIPAHRLPKESWLFLRSIRWPSSLIHWKRYSRKFAPATLHSVLKMLDKAKEACKHSDASQNGASGPSEFSDICEVLCALRSREVIVGRPC